MSIQTELTRITNAKATIKTAVEGKGVTVPDGTLLDGMAALIDSIEAGGGTGAGDLFYTEVTPATGGEVLTLEVGETGERIVALMVSVKVETTTALKFNKPIKEIAAINNRPSVSMTPFFDNLIVYTSGGMQEKSIQTSGQSYDRTPDGSAVNKVYNIWNSESVKPWVKLYITNGEEAKYGLLVGDTYDIWVIKAG